MRRRDILLSLMLAGPIPCAWAAQQVTRQRRIAVFTPFGFTEASQQAALHLFKQAIAELGWHEGLNVIIDHRGIAESTEQADAFAKELVDHSPDVVLTTTAAAHRAIQRQSGTIPIVFIGIVDPVGQGFVESLARPGGNSTGFTTFEFAMGGKWVGLLKEIVPSISVATVIYNSEPVSGGFLQSMRSSANSVAINLAIIQVHDEAEIERALEEVGQASNAGLIVSPESFMMRHRQLIVDLAAQRRVPTIYPFRRFTVIGGLISYGVDLDSLWVQGASYIDRILTGARPADLPVQQPTKFELVVNLKPARALDLEIPPSLLARADEVIE